MINFYLKIPHRLKVILLIFVVLFILLVVFLPKKPSPQLPSPSPSPISAPKENFSSYLNQLNQPEAELKIINITPQPPVFETLWSTEKLTIQFNSPLKPETIRYLFLPDTKTKLVFDPQKPDEFSIIPFTGWQENQVYTITLKADLTATAGEKLSKDITISLTRKLPPEGSLIFPPNN
ncbi:MAG: Ig-like domain-containing protein [Candidatus Beckwithbacteria bacterium]